MFESFGLNDRAIYPFGARSFHLRLFSVAAVRPGCRGAEITHVIGTTPRSDCIRRNYWPDYKVRAEPMQGAIPADFCSISIGISLLLALSQEGSNDG
jgi:hypothetical protein